VAGQTGVRGSLDGPRSKAGFNGPMGITVGRRGLVYVADTGNHTIRVINPSGVVSTLAGQSGVPGSADGVTTSARFNSPRGIRIDGEGNLYVADCVNNTIRKISSAGVVTTIGGLAGHDGSRNGTGTDARFYAPEDLVLDTQGNIYVGDDLNNTIRKGHRNAQAETGNGAVISAPAATDASASQPRQRWTNSLGMVFVPVPGTSVRFSIWDTRVQDYADYWASSPSVNDSWNKVEYQGVRVSDGPDHPVTMVSWNDAQRFCRWLTEKERREGRIRVTQSYRLPTDSEWSVAVGLDQEDGSTPQEKAWKIQGVYPWGTEWPPPRGSGNYADMSAKRRFSNCDAIEGYDDGYATTSPVGSFKANQYGLYDMGGNVVQWCEDWFNNEQKDRVVRGEDWFDGGPVKLLSSRRLGFPSDYRGILWGFRCVLAESSP
jgi:hypothetical protein